MNGRLAPLCCPITGANLSLEGSRVLVEGSPQHYAVNDGIVDLRCKDYYFNPVARPAMTELTQRAAQVPWGHTVRAFLQHVHYDPEWLDKIASDGRYAWKLLLDLKPDATVLDLDCGLGNLTRNLAPHVGRVYAMDLTIERLRFAQQRFARFNADDDIVLVASGGGLRLPFADRSLDVVALSGVLEWVADDDDTGTPGTSRLRKVLQMTLSFFGERNPRAIQTRFLREIRRVLKPEGQLFVAIENRYNQEYFHSRVDHHSGLRYGSLLPRFVANAYSIAVNRRPYRTYTYSLDGYRRLLGAAGFAEQQFFGLFPGYSHLAEITPLVTAPRFWQPRPAANLKERLVRHHNLVPAYGIVASASADSNSLLGRVVADIAARLGSDKLKASELRISGKGKGLLELVSDSRAFVAKLPFNAESLRGLECQQRNLDALCKALPYLEPWLPRCRVAGHLQGVHYFVEPKLPGQTLGSQPQALSDPRQLLEIGALLENIHAGTGAQTVFDGEFFDTEVEAPLRRIAQALDDPKPLTPLARLLRSRLAGAPARCGMVHGDFSVSNLLVDDGRISGLIDWEDSRAAGLPILDAINFLDSAQRRRDARATIDDTTAMLAEQRWPVPGEWAFLLCMYDVLGAAFDRHREYIYLYWAHHVSNQLDGALIYDGAQIERRILRVLTRFA